MEMKTWADLAKTYSLVLFNECVNLNDGEVLHEWLENHDCEQENMRLHLDQCDKENCTQCEEIKNDYGDCPECACEPFQWFAIGASEWTVEHLNNEYDLDIFYSDYLQMHILPVYHFGTGWDHVNLK